ncbi:hypothetical protein ACTFIV_010337 [Dictyostelium citrinum]
MNLNKNNVVGGNKKNSKINKITTNNLTCDGDNCQDEEDENEKLEKLSKSKKRGNPYYCFGSQNSLKVKRVNKTGRRLTHFIVPPYDVIFEVCINSSDDCPFGSPNILLNPPSICDDQEYDEETLIQNYYHSTQLCQLSNNNPSQDLPFSENKQINNNNSIVSKNNNENEHLSN